MASNGTRYLYQSDSFPSFVLIRWIQLLGLKCGSYFFPIPFPIGNLHELDRDPST